MADPKLATLAYAAEPWCRRCGFGKGHTKWITRLPDGQLPVRCPRCSSSKWQVPAVMQVAKGVTQ